MAIMTPARTWQTAIFVLAAIGVSLVWLIFRPGVEAQAILLAPMVCILGLPHGALDLAIAERLWPLDTMHRKQIFLALYLGIAAAVGLVWLVLPSVGLTAFLLYSAWHFSGDWVDDRRIMQATGGISAVAAPVVFHQAEVATLFAYLAPVEEARIIASATASLGMITLAILIRASLARSANRTRAAVEQSAIWILAAILPPLLYFICYFCFLHSIRHFDTAMGQVRDQKRALKSALLLSLVTLLGAAGLAFILMQADQSRLSLLIQLVFVGLAALTVPHMVLVDRLRAVRIGQG